jgi:DNA topoisomerase-1
MLHVIGSSTDGNGKSHGNGITAVSEPAAAAAKAASLRYVTDAAPGIIRRTNGSGFVYVGANGKRVRDAAQLQRIKSLVIPPAWTDVWICALADGHLQATGRDARGRKQYRYHPRWREVRDTTKYDRMASFAGVLPQIRKQVQHDLSLPGLSREKVLAAVVQLLESTSIRVGNEQYAKENGSFGLATMKNRHVDIHGGKIRFQFRGKSGVKHAIDLNDKRLAKIIKRCQDLPGYELFQYVADDGELQDVHSSDVNDYLKQIAGDDFSTKDFRTWSGTVLAAGALKALDPARSSEAELKRNIVQAIEFVAKRLGNTKAVCRKCYIHPAIIEAYRSGSLFQAPGTAAAQKRRGRRGGLKAEELAVAELLRRHAKLNESSRRRRKHGRPGVSKRFYL